MDECVENRDAEGQESVAGQAADEVVFFAGTQMHEFCKIVTYKKEGGKDRKEPCIISVA